ncbi:hypothetical protein [Maribacter sp. Asnod2-G09]|uniref:hypothetical protein n=1 Tax=Maribacter sp. Asnod2-G09 TaxID=3160577 RepID=UPI003870051E
MLKLKIVVIGLLAIVSCNCQDKVLKSGGDTIENNESEYISAILQEKNFNILKRANLIVDYEIKKQLIAGTKDEYSNKLFLKDTLNERSTEALLSLLKNDASYDWAVVPVETDFEPYKQLLIKSDVGRLSLMIDKDFERMSFINLEGQKLMLLSKELSSFFKKM